MLGRWTRSTAALVAMTAAVVASLGACSNDKDDKKASSTTTTSASSSSTSTTTGSGEATTSSTSGGSGASTSTSAPPAGSGTDDGEGVIVLTITGGNVEGGVRRETVKQGSQVTLRATSDVADELHLHGYDLKTELTPGQSADLTFLAKIPGVFEVELENRGKKVLELEVKP